MDSQVPENIEQTRELTAAEIMPAGVPSVELETSIADVLRLMVEHDVAGVAVVENDEIVGIITESDVIARQKDVEEPTVVPFFDAIFVADAGRAYEDEIRRVLATTAGELMTSPVTSVKSAANLEQIATIMLDHDVHPLPVVDENNRYIGIVSRRDLVRLIAEMETRVS
ncbi:MAG: CBS domain-containing protein [Chloroflexi bacterium]|nr:CBS domain-containing protein [Chloroflexota bacterium]